MKSDAAKQKRRINIDVRNIISYLIPLLNNGSVIALYGDLGSGKTFFCDHLINALNHGEPLDLTSHNQEQQLILQKSDLFDVHKDENISDIKYQKMLVKKINVTSPTFNIINIYQIRSHFVYHCDLYRIKNIDEVIELGIIDMLDQGIWLIEWPNIIAKYLPKHTINLYFDVTNDHKITFKIGSSL